MEKANTTARVPAWKRIGLKLKYAKDTADENTPPISRPSPNQDTIRSGKRSAEDVEPETPLKRVKPSKSERRNRDSTSQIAMDSAAKKTPKRIVFDEEGESTTPAAERPASLRKSVSFTPDTKAEDGFSASNFFKAWSNGDSTADSEPNLEAESTSPSKESIKEQKKPKKPKKSKSTLLPPQEKSPKPPKEHKEPQVLKTEGETPSYVHYLQTFHTSKATWKFNKNQQQTLLKNLSNIYRIPPQHNPAVVAYIAGLQGSARQRVAQEAADILKTFGGDDAAAASPTERREACSAALQTRVKEYSEQARKSTSNNDKDEKLETLRRDTERGKRAEAILQDALNDDELLRSVFTVSSNGLQQIPPRQGEVAASTTQEAQSDTRSQQRKKRKARTDVSSSSSSSSESSSSESESSESESESDGESD